MLATGPKLTCYKIYHAIEQFLPQIIALRRDLHAHPELCYEEYRTSDIIAKYLSNYGYKVTRGFGKTGLVGQLRAGSNKAASKAKTISLRADFDALPIEEQTNLPHQSRHKGKMHACGHDGHTAMLLGAARYLAQSKNFNGIVNVIFQPAEEGGAGAKAMIDDGLFAKFPTDAIFALHNWPNSPLGRIASGYNAFMPASARANITLYGKAGHSALPHLVKDPLAAGALLVSSLYNLAPQIVHPRESALLAITKFASIGKDCAFPDKAEISLAVRSLSNEAQLALEQAICHHIHSQAQCYGLRAEIDYRHYYPVLFNHKKETAFALAKAQELFGPQYSCEIAHLSGSEDFAYMLEQCPGAYLTLGTGAGADLHTAFYDFNDDALIYGMVFWSYLVEQYLA